MKKLLFLICLLVTTASFAQQGVITYQITINHRARMPVNRPEMGAALSEAIHSEAQLFFTDTVSFYKSAQIATPAVPNGKGGMEFRRPASQIYINYKSGNAINLQEYKNKSYVVSDTLAPLPWKLGTETKTILGYTCRKASYTFQQELYAVRSSSQEPGSSTEKILHSQEIVAWYTEQLKPSAGPEKYHSLPGMVLELDINNGEEKYVAKKIDHRTLTPEELQVPSKGIPMTREKYKKMVADDRAKQ